MKQTTTNWVYRCIVVFVFSFTSQWHRTDALPGVGFNDGNTPDFYSLGINYTESDRDDDGPYADYTRSNLAFPKSPSLCSDCVCGAGRKSRIVGGSLSEIAEFPWMVAILWAGQFHCGASLITPKHVLTAAHCLEGYPREYFELRLGIDEIGDQSANLHRRRIKLSIVHENFTRYSLNNDIAIIELDKPVPIDGTIRTACLPQDQAIDYTGSFATAIGWGRTKEGSEVSKFLRHVQVPVLSDEECDHSGYPKKRRTDNMFCAGYLEGRLDACSGDSGGPLVVQAPHGHQEVIGITSFGRGCARPNFPGVYTKLTNYIGWLHDQLQGECVCRPPGNR